MKLKALSAVMLAAGILAAPVAEATNGYFSHGYGIKAKGRGGAQTATIDDAYGGASNPATMVWAGNRFEIGADIFSPVREASRVGSRNFGTGTFDFNTESSRNYFAVPDMAFNYMLNPNLSLGVTMYGNGGMNTTWSGGAVTTGGCRAFGGGNPANPLCGVGDLGVDLMQLIIAPTASFKLAPQHSIGVSPLIGIQRFEAYGLDRFGGISSDPLNLTNKGYEWSTGFGARVGYLGNFGNFRVGAAYSTKMWMSEFDSYKGLFAEQGDLDIPENWNIGVAWQATPELLLALDYQQINYNKIASVGNSSRVPGCIPGPTGGTGAACLGASGSSIGFGWSNISIFKLGVEYKLNPATTLRAGWDHSENPISASDVTFNILAPGVITDHLTLGVTYALSPTSEISAAYMHAFENEVQGAANNPYFPVGGTETIQMYQNSLGVSWTMKF